MNISKKELELAGFRRAGTVYPDKAKVLRLDLNWDATGFVVYVMVVNQEFKKAGTTGRKQSTLRKRMSSTFSALRQVIEGAPPGRPPARWRSRPLDPFKKHAPAALRASQEVELWALECPSFEAMVAKETELNNKYESEWTKEGRHRLKTRIPES